jgi:hypothetical protein
MVGGARFQEVTKLFIVAAGVGDFLAYLIGSPSLFPSLPYSAAGILVGFLICFATGRLMREDYLRRRGNS